MLTTDNQIWYEKYRPQRVDDMVLPPGIIQKLKEFLEKPYHLLLCSLTPGTGKTSTVNSLVKEGQFEALFINASLDNGIDTLRSKIVQFASTESINGKDKIVIWDECDSMSHPAQNACRGIIEEFSTNCKFIATCNYVSKILPAIVNRFCVIDYDKLYQNQQVMIPLVFNRLKYILDNENISYNVSDLQNVIKATYPSLRSAVGALQKSVTGNKLDLQVDSFAEFSDLAEAIKSKNYSQIVKSAFVLSNADGFYSWAFDRLNKLASQAVNPNAYIILAKYQYQGAFARDAKLNLVACCVELASISVVL